MASSAGKRVRKKTKTWDEETIDTEKRISTSKSQKKTGQSISAEDQFRCENGPWCIGSDKTPKFTVGFYISLNPFNGRACVHPTWDCYYCHHKHPDPVGYGKCRVCGNQRYLFTILDQPVCANCNAHVL